MKKLFPTLTAIMLVLSILNVTQAGGVVRAVLTLPVVQQSRSIAIKFALRQIREANPRKRQTIKARYPQAVAASSDPRLTKLNQELRKFIEKEVAKFRIEGQPPEERTFSSGSTFESKYSVR